MLPDRRTAVLAGGTLAAITALALSGCAPAGSNDAYGTPQNQPAAIQAGGQPAGGQKKVPPKEAPEEKAPVKTPGIVATKLTSKVVARMGEVVTDQNNFVLYRFDKDGKNAKTSACVKKCAKVWPPMLSNGRTQLQGIDSDLVTTVTRDDGTKQLAIGGWLVYRYIGDKKAGTWKGQNVGKTWFVVTSTGGKNLTCLPKNVPAPPEPPADEPTGNGGGDEEPTTGGGGYGDGY